MKITCPTCGAALIANFSTTNEDAVCEACKQKIDLAGLLSIDSELSQTRTVTSPTLPVQMGDEVSQFRIGKILGSGGFGCVFEAYDLRLERKVALKLPRMKSLDPHTARVFIREAQAAAQLKNPNIVSVFEIGRDKDQVYIVSELIEGETLKEWTESHKPNVVESALILAKIARALGAAHNRGVIHRDVKPRNIIVDEAGEPHITDFGLAVRVDRKADSYPQHGAIVGTLPYMSPEQASGNAGKVDGRTDVYSLGIILYEMLVGQRPYRGETDSITEEIIHGDAPAPHALDSSINRDISAICMKAIATKPGDRFHNAQEMAEDLERFARGLPVKSRALGPLEQVRRFVKRNLVGVTTTTAFSLLGLLAILSMINNGVQDAEMVLVNFHVTPPRADVVIAKVDQKLGRVDLEKAIPAKRISDKDGYEVELEPGFYIVEASMPGMGVQEVRRIVSTMPDQTTGYSHSNWKKVTARSGNQKHIRWPDITISNPPVPRGPGESPFSFGIEFVRIKGGQLNLAEPDEQARIVRVEDFLIGTAEINAGQYRAVMNTLPPAMIQEYKKQGISENEIPDSEIVTFVTYFDVLEFCERTGTRPMLLDEYLFVATNAGTTQFPWGDSAPADWQRNWGQDYLPPAEPNVLGYPKLRGFYSGQMEWTQEFRVPINPQNGTPFSASSVSGLGSDERYVVDGPPAYANGYLFDEKTDFNDVRQPTSLKPDNRYPNVGFRCAISIQPRLNVPPVE